jgi:hypothetical protein
MESMPRRDFLGGAVGLMAAVATGGCAPMAGSPMSLPGQSVPKFAYVGSYTTKERKGNGEGINVYQVDAATTFRFDAEGGELKPLQVITTLPPAFTGNSTTSEIAVTPLGRFVYGSNRGHDSLAMFSVDSATGVLGPSAGSRPRARRRASSPSSPPGHTSTRRIRTATPSSPSGWTRRPAGSSRRARS